MTAKEEFLQIVRTTVKRDGIENLLNYLENECDFFSAPASTKYHGSYAGGLVDHSLNVFYNLKEELNFIFGKGYTKRYSDESIVIVSLFHDLCKIGRYTEYYKNVKDEETGIWGQQKCYKYNQDYFTMGHASLSLYTIQKYIKLTEEEAQAIYWHMGAYDLSQYSDSMQLFHAFQDNTLAFALHRADMLATHVCENDKFKPIADD
jgi:hypothetical protein